MQQTNKPSNELTKGGRGGKWPGEEEQQLREREREKKNVKMGIRKTEEKNDNGKTEI